MAKPHRKMLPQGIFVKPIPVLEVSTAVELYTIHPALEFEPWADSVSRFSVLPWKE